MKVKARFSFTGVSGSVRRGDILDITEPELLKHYQGLRLVGPAEQPSGGPKEQPEGLPEETPEELPQEIKALGGGWYELPDGDKAHGKDEAWKKYRALVMKGGDDK